MIKDAYYVRLARKALTSAVRKLEQAQEYLAEAGESQADMDEIGRIIQRVRRESNGLGWDLRQGFATDKVEDK